VGAAYQNVTCQPVADLLMESTRHGRQV